MHKRVVFPRFLNCLLLSTLLSWSAFAEKSAQTVINLTNHAPSALTPFNAKYSVHRGNLTLGKVKRQLTQLSDDKFVFSYMSDLSFLILSDKRKESAEIQLIDGQIRPIKYLYKREGTGSNKRTTLKFNHQTRHVFDGIKGKQIECDETIDWYDQISYQLQMKLDIEQGKSDLTYYLIDSKKREKLYQFEKVAAEQLVTPAGTFDTIKFERVLSNKSRSTQVWIAPKLGNLLVRVRQEKEGSEQADAILESVTFNAIN
ncbi:DUF3108 domain-containing protein [Saccharobesus litoralis]|nr:DUF3108 domain-containing protein [Saccharobesus litoralis]